MKSLLLCLALVCALATSVSAQCPGGVCPPRSYSYGGFYRPSYQYRPSYYGAYRYQAPAMYGPRYVYGPNGQVYLTR